MSIRDRILAPPDRSLRTFEGRPLANQDEPVFDRTGMATSIGPSPMKKVAISFAADRGLPAFRIVCVRRRRN